MPPILNRSAEWLSRATDPLRRFLHWWLSELEVMYEAWFGARFAAARSRARIEIGREAILLFVHDGRGWTEASCSERPAVAEHLPAAITSLLASQPRTLREIEIRLPGDRILLRPVELPAAVRRRLRTAIEYQLDRLTPFRPADLYFDCQESGSAARPGHLKVALAVAPRKEVNALALAADPSGTCRILISAEGETTSSLFRLLQRRGRVVRDLAGRIELGLAVSATVLAIAVLGAAAWRLSAEQQQIDTRLYALRVQATHAEDARQALSQRLARIEFLSRQASTVDAAQLLSALTHDLPADGWVFQLQQEAGTVEISGFAHNASAVAATLGKNPLFENAQLRSAMQLPGNSNERFDIALTLRPSTTSSGAVP